MRRFVRSGFGQSFAEPERLAGSSPEGPKGDSNLVIPVSTGASCVIRRGSYFTAARQL
jgi:hypothetical protein